MSASKSTPVASDLLQQRWTAVKNRDRTFDGSFWYSVRTTGVYCRPSCAARLPRPENVEFHDSCADAERAGFRPCKRCRPNEGTLAERQAARIAAACRVIERSDAPLSLDALAEQAGMSRFHFHRVFKSVTGLTPKHYADAARARRVREGLSRAQNVTAAVYDAGFNSNGRFYAQAKQILGMSPGAFRAGGANTSIRFAIAECWIGAVLVGFSEHGVCWVALGDASEDLVSDLRRRFPKAELSSGDPEFERLVARVVRAVTTSDPGQDLPLDVRGTAFQQRVWEALRQIPPGETATYQQVAARIGQPEAVRAVARACASNEIAVLIPCHRVVRSDGAPSGYRWGVERKRALLAREAQCNETLEDDESRRRQ